MKIYLNIILIFFSTFSYSQGKDSRLLNLVKYYNATGDSSIADSLLKCVDSTNLIGSEFKQFLKLKYRTTDISYTTDELEKESNIHEIKIINLYKLDQMRTSYLDSIIRPQFFDFIIKGYYSKIKNENIQELFEVILLHQCRTPEDKYTCIISELIDQNIENGLWSKEFCAAIIDDIEKSKGNKSIFGMAFEMRNQFGCIPEETIDDTKLNNRRISFGLTPINLYYLYFKNKIFLINKNYMAKIGYISPFEYLYYESFNNK